MSHNFDKAYFFGDSMSDTGYVLSLTGGQFPNAPYEPGRFSNGDVWVDSVAEELDLTIDSFPQNTGMNDGLNFAIGGATSGEENFNDLLPGLSQQLRDFEIVQSIQSPEETFEDDLFSVLIGANDYFNFIEDDGSTPEVVEANFPQNGKERKKAVLNVVDTNIKGAIEEIIDAGGKNIMLLNLPDLDKTPLGKSLEKEDRKQLKRLTNLHNRKLSRLARKTEKAYPDVNIIEVDVNELFDDVIDNPDEFGFTDVTSNYTGIDLYTELPITGVGGDVDEFFFWDSAHPTTKAHGLFADLVLDRLTDEGLIT